MEKIGKHLKSLNIDRYKDFKASNDAIRNLSLVQPNKVTSAKYEYDEREEDILTHIIDALQGYMTRTKDIDKDFFNNPMITIHPSSKYEKRRYLQSLDKMIRKVIQFEWSKEEQGRNIKTTAVLISAYHDNLNTLSIGISLNAWALPYLLYWGKGVGGTIFNKRIALTLTGKYTKRLYKLCKRWEDKGGHYVSLDDFKLWLNLPKSYNITNIKKRVLDTSRSELMNSADVYFNYSLTRENGSRSLNTINFKIFPNPKNVVTKNSTQKPVTHQKGEVYAFVYNIISLAYPAIENSISFDIVEKLSQHPEQLKNAYNRFKRLKDSGTDLSENIPLIKYIIDNDFGFNYMKKSK